MSTTLMKRRMHLNNIAGVAAGLIFSASAWSQSISIPNGSFESQSGEGQPFGVNILVDAWEKPARPDYFISVETNFGIYWIQTAGVFLDTNTPYANLDQKQAAYLLSFPQAALYQDYDSHDWSNPEPTHAFDTIYEPGKSYRLTVGVFGKNMTPGSMLNLSLYYRQDGSMVPVSSTTITYNPADFPTGQPRSLVDYQVNVPTVLPTDAWAGQHIGIKLESMFGYGDGYWDIDNIRLMAVPEPATFSLAGVGLGGCLLYRRIWGRRA